MPASINQRRYPKSPVLAWKSLSGKKSSPSPAIDQLPHRIVTSGRAAIFHALQALKLPAGTPVLIPTYHCPTMVAPLILAGLQPRFYGIAADGTPLLANVDAAGIGAVLYSHYFGIPRSLATLREWCNAHQAFLIEDCAHTFFGQAGERQIGAWGDFSTASATKFFPLHEAGLIAAGTRELPVLSLEPQGWSAELRGLWDVLENGATLARSPAPGDLLAPAYWLKRKLRSAESASTPDDGNLRFESLEQALAYCSMEHIHAAPLRASVALHRKLPRNEIIRLRRQHYLHYHQALSTIPGAQALFPDLPDGAAPYVYPLLFENPEPVYRALRERHMPVFRWDLLWPGTPSIAGDAGIIWSRQVLQFLCHQSLSEADIREVVAFTAELSHQTR